MGLHPGFTDPQTRRLNAADAARQAYLYRPDDIDLGKWWNAMRLKQREDEYAMMKYNQQQANALNPMAYGYGYLGILGSDRCQSSNWTKE